MASQIVHGTAVGLGGRAALLLGSSGAGKSDLAFRFLSTDFSQLENFQPQFVGDDRVELIRDAGGVLVRPVEALIGLLEVRGVGILKRPCVDQAQLSLCVELCDEKEMPRLPDLPNSHRDIMGVEVPCLKLWPHAASAPQKLFVQILAISKLCPVLAENV